MSDEEKIRLLRSKRTIMEVEKAVTGEAEKSILDQVTDVGKVFEKVRDVLTNPIAKPVIEGVAREMQKALSPQEATGLEGMGMTQDELNRLKENVSLQPQLQGQPQPQAERRPQTAIVPASEIHSKLMVVFNEIPESKIHDFVAKFVGSEEIENIRGKIKPFVS